MKNTFCIFLTTLLLLTSGCSSEKAAQLPVISGKVGVRTDRVWDDGAPQAAASRASVALTYVLEAWTTGSTPQRAFRQSLTGVDVTFDLRLVPGTYDFLFWADAGTTSGYDTGDAQGLRAVTLTTPYTPGEGHDAYACTLKAVTVDAQFALTATLRRPLACLMLRNKDAVQIPQGTAVTVTYRNLPTRYDVLTGKASEPLPSLTATLGTLSENTTELGTDFLFAPGPDSPVSAEITVGAVTKTLDPLPLEANKRTIVTAKFNPN